MDGLEVCRALRAMAGMNPGEQTGSDTERANPSHPDLRPCDNHLSASHSEFHSLFAFAAFFCVFLFISGYAVYI